MEPSGPVQAWNGIALLLHTLFYSNILYFFSPFFPCTTSIKPQKFPLIYLNRHNYSFVSLPILTHCGRVTQICVFNTVKLGTSASSP